MAHADNTADVMSQIKTAYKQMDAAISQKDLAAAFAFYEPDYTHVVEAGHVQYLADQQREAQTVMTHSQALTSNTQVTSAVVSGSKATVTIIQQIDVTAVLPQMRQSAVLQNTELDTEVWVKHAGKWRVQSGRTFSSHETLNGRPFSSADIPSAPATPSHVMDLATAAAAIPDTDR
jgi:ketosteroid isomerase-like protein